jgi:spermidine/putrescine transport system permease protein
VTITATPPSAAPPEQLPTPAPAAPPKAPRRKFRSRLLGIWAFLVYLWLFAPIVVMIVFSFNKPTGKFNITWNEFTFDNWLNPFSKQEYTDALITSLQIAVIASLVATVLGGLMGFAISRHEFRGKGLVNILLVLPLTTPEIVLGSSLFTLFFARNLSFGFGTVLIAHILFCLSFVALTIEARVRGFEWTLVDAAMDLGSSPWRAFRTVTFPLILPGIAAAAMLSFALSIDDYIITSFVAGDATETFPMRIFNANKTELPPQINVIATGLLILIVGLISIGTIRTMRREAKL